MITSETEELQLQYGEEKKPLMKSQVQVGHTA